MYQRPLANDNIEGDTSRHKFVYNPVLIAKKETPSTVKKEFTNFKNAGYTYAIVSKSVDSWKCGTI